MSTLVHTVRQARRSTALEVLTRAGFTGYLTARILARPAGRVVAGLAAFGVCCFVQSRYRRV